MGVKCTTSNEREAMKCFRKNITIIATLIVPENTQKILDQRKDLQTVVGTTVHGSDPRFQASDANQRLTRPTVLSIQITRRSVPDSYLAASVLGVTRDPRSRVYAKGIASGPDNLCLITKTARGGDTHGGKEIAPPNLPKRRPSPRATRRLVKATMGRGRGRGPSLDIGGNMVASLEIGPIPRRAPQLVVGTTARGALRGDEVPLES
uniref:Uncharacterized protein n=1 Tax=Solanum tuberosum TaxID=4113 RepID=M1DNG4_SOLTU